MMQGPSADSCSGHSNTRRGVLLRHRARGWAAAGAGANAHKLDTAGCQYSPLARVFRLELTSDRKDQNDVFGGKPPIFRDIPITAREDEFPPAFFRSPSESRMIG